jgi:outer membrane cobalamin receptor
MKFSQVFSSGLVAAVTLSCLQVVQAEELPTFYLPDVVFTATKTNQNIKKIPAAVQVITEKQIANSGAVFSFRRFAPAD